MSDALTPTEGLSFGRIFDPSAPTPGTPAADPTRPPPKPSLPTADEAFPLPTAEEAFPDPKPFVNKLPLVDHFVRGFDTGFGEGLLKTPINKSDPNSMTVGDWMRKVGIFAPADGAKRNIVRTFNESLLTSASTLFQSIPGVIYGASEVLHSAFGVPKDLTPAAAFEAFPLGHATPGYPRTISPRAVTPYNVDWNAAAELGVLGDQTAANVAREKLSPGSTPTEFPLRGTSPEAPPPAESPLATGPIEAHADPIHAAARQINPQVIDLFDELQGQKRTLTDWIDEQSAAKPTVQALQSEIETILGKVNNVESRLTQRAASRLELLRDGLEEAKATDTPEIAFARQFRQRIDEQLRDIAPEYTAAYEEARRLTPLEKAAEPEVAATAAEPAAPQGAMSLEEQAAHTSDRIGRLKDQLDEAKDPHDIANLKGAIAREETNLERLEDQIKRGDAPDTAAVEPRTIGALTQRARAISTDTAARLESAGVPRDVAAASGLIIQAYYQARAARFSGALGTAQELYQREAPWVRAAEGTQRGGILLRQTRNIIRLMERSDASTFMHESAHNWLEDLRKDAAHEAAPPDLVSDFSTVREWLGAEGDAALTRAQHEKFARGFERYLMEGQAPSPKLVSVFEKFKQWLTDIYQSVARLRAPITDDIRAVYDRLLSTPSREPIIASERPGARTFAEDARAAVDETPAAEAAARADREASLRERVAERLREDINERRREARRGPARVGVSEERVAEPGAEAGGKIVAETDGSVGGVRDPTAPPSETPPSGTDTFDGSTRLVDKAGNIRIENLAVPADVAEAIREAAGRNSNFLEARRGVLSDAEVLKLSEDLGVDPNKLDRWSIAEAWTAEQIIFARKLLRESATKVLDAAKRLEAFDSEESLAAYAEAVKVHDMIQERVSAVTAESGRAFRLAFRTLSAEDRAANTISALLQRATGMTPAQLRVQARLVAAAPDPALVNKLVQDSKTPPKPGAIRMLHEAFINGLVSGPWTHVVNLATNFGAANTIILETAAAAGVGRIFRALGKEQGVTFGEAVDRAHGLSEGALDGLKAFGAVIMDEDAAPRTHTEVGYHRAIPKSINIAGVKIPAGTVIRIFGRTLTAEDELFKAIAWQQEINVLARRTAIREGLTGDALNARMNWHKANPSDAMKAAAEQFAEYQTFQTELGSIGKSLVGGVQAMPILGFVLPFIRTPINIFKYANERTPLGLLSREVRARLMSDNPAVRDTQIARMAIGSMASMGLGYLAFQGFVTGSGPQDADERAAWIRGGNQPYSVRIGDMWISYKRLDPFATVAGLAADAAAIAKYGITGKDFLGQDRELDRFLYMSVFAGYNNIIDKMSLRGVTSLVQAVTDTKRYGETWLQGMVGSFIPGGAALGQVARMMDPYERELQLGVPGMWDAVKSRIPWAREDLYPKRDIWGEPMESTEYGPVRAQMFNADPVNHIMLDLGIAKARPHKQINGVVLTPGQYDEYARVSGTLAKEILNGVVLQPGFTEMPKGAQVTIINNVIDQARHMGVAHIMGQSIGTADDLVKKGLDVRTMFLETGHRH